MQNALIHTPDAAIVPTFQDSDAELIVSAFLSQISARKKSSRALYARTIRQFLCWINATGRDLRTMSAADIIAYRDDLDNGNPAAGISKKADYTVSSYVDIVRRFYAWAEANKLYPNIAAGIKGGSRCSKFKRDYLTAEQARELVATVGETNLRDNAIINLLLRAGLRTIEVVTANVGDLELRGGRHILNVQGKGHTEKDDFVILTDKCYSSIIAYLATRGDLEPDAPLFACKGNRNKNGRLTTRSISAIARDNLDRIGLQDRKYTAHSLRHTCACLMIEEDIPDKFVQLELRHKFPATTQLYTHHTDEHRRLQVAAVTVLDNIF